MAFNWKSWLSWRRWFMDWQLKLVAILLGLGLWIYVSGSSTVKLSMTVPLEFRNVPRNARFVRNPPSMVQVRLKTSSERNIDLTAKVVRAVVDLSGTRERRLEITLTPDNIIRPAGIDVVEIIPPSIQIELTYR